MTKTMSVPRLDYSVAMCTYNGARHVRHQLESIERQSTKPKEVIICDDGSMDNTLDILTSYSVKAPYSIRIIKNRARLGIAKNFEKAISLCSSEVIFLSDQDDYWLPHRVQAYLDIFMNNEEVVFVASNSTVVSESLEETGLTLWSVYHIPNQLIKAVNDSRNSLPFFLRRHSFLGHSLAFRSVVKDFILPIPTDQYDFWIALASPAIGRVVLIPDCLTLYRKHPNQVSTGSSGEDFRELARNTVPTTHFDSEIEKLTELLNRIQKHNYDEVKHRVLLAELVKSKIAYMDCRRRMRSEGLWRFVMILKLLLRGDYHKLGRGFLTAGRDLLG